MTDSTLRRYIITTEKFGEVAILAENIEAARADARRRFKIKNPALVRAERTYTECADCESRPCCCKER